VGVTAPATVACALDAIDWRMTPISYGISTVSNPQHTRFSRDKDFINVSCGTLISALQMFNDH
jgi:hypothetical protein